MQHHSYLVCATPRSGSTLFCESMNITGVAGHPKEYFEHLQETGLPRQPYQYFETFADYWEYREIAAILGPLDLRIDSVQLARFHGPAYAQYLTEVFAEGTTPNGVFGAKMMWNYFDDFLHHLRGIPSYQEVDVYELLNTVFPHLQYIWVKRRDTAKQAVSLWKAIQTQHWRHDTRLHTLTHTANLKEPSFHFAAIAHLERQIVANEQAWQSFFQARGIQPLVIIYEQFVTAYQETIRDALRYLGISFPENKTVAMPPMKQQADSLSSEWLRRYQQYKESVESYTANDSALVFLEDRTDPVS